MSIYSKQILITTIRELFPTLEKIEIESHTDQPLTGVIFRLSRVDLVYMFLELEKRLGLIFRHQMLDNYGFSSIDKIASLIDQSEKSINTLT